MIGYLEGKLMERSEDRILLLCGHVGYEVLLPATVMQGIEDKQPGDALSLFIYHQLTERQPKPVLIGFKRALEKTFFQHFISVGDIGPLKAVRAMTVPISDIAAAIEAGDAGRLSRLKGIGRRTAEKMIASLRGKMGGFVSIKPESPTAGAGVEDIVGQVLDVLTSQLGHKAADARQMIVQAMTENPSIRSAEALFEAVYRAGNTAAGSRR